MLRQAVSSGADLVYPRLQILTLAELFQGKKPAIPIVDPDSVKRAKREEAGRQERLLSGAAMTSDPSAKPVTHHVDVGNALDTLDHRQMLALAAMFERWR